MRLSLRQRLAIIGIFVVGGALLGVPNREAILSNTSPNPNDFTALFLEIIQTSALIDLLASIPGLGLLFIGVATQSIGVVVGVIVLDHKTIPINPLIGLTITSVFDVTANVVAGLAGFRLMDFFESRHSHEPGKGHFYAYLKLLGVALSIALLGALWESASILGMLPFGL
jgi:hypothetical protein